MAKPKINEERVKRMVWQPGDLVVVEDTAVAENIEEEEKEGKAPDGAKKKS
jgi:hypothetical protein